MGEANSFYSSFFHAGQKAPLPFKSLKKPTWYRVNWRIASYLQDTSLVYTQALLMPTAFKIFTQTYHWVNRSKYFILKIQTSIHSHTKRNSLDTRAVFTEFSEYVNNSGVVVYCDDRSFSRSSMLTMALKEFWHF